MNLTMNRTEYLLNKKVSPLFSRFCQQINESICDQNVDLNELEIDQTNPKYNPVNIMKD